MIPIVRRANRTPLRYLPKDSSCDAFQIASIPLIRPHRIPWSGFQRIPSLRLSRRAPLELCPNGSRCEAFEKPFRSVIQMTPIVGRSNRTPLWYLPKDSTCDAFQIASLGRAAHRVPIVWLFNKVVCGAFQRIPSVRPSNFH